MRFPLWRGTQGEENRSHIYFPQAIPSLKLEKLLLINYISSMRSNHPKLSPELTKFDKVVNVLGWFAFVGFLTSVLFTYSKLPDVIPVHYALNGEADRWAIKSEIWMLVVVVGVVFLLLTLLAYRPRLANIPVRITEDNAQGKYNIVARMIRVTRFTITSFFLAFFWIAIYKSDVSVFWLVICGVSVIVFPVIYYFWKLLSNKT